MVRLVDRLETGQAMILVDDLRAKLPYDVNEPDLHNLTSGQFIERYHESKTSLVRNLRLPVWVAVKPSNKKGGNQCWKVANPNGETKVIGYGDIFCLATIGHGTETFQRWVVLEDAYDEAGKHLFHKGVDIPLGRLKQYPFAFQEPFKNQWFTFKIHRSNFVVQMLPYGASFNKRGIADFKDVRFVMNFGHLNEYNAKFYKSKHGMGYLVPATRPPEYSISKRLNAIAYEHGGNNWPQSIRRIKDDAQVFYVALSYLEPYAIPDDSLEPKTLHILNWVVTGCDELIHANL